MSVELYRRNSATRKDNEGPILPPPEREKPEDLTPIEKPRVMLSEDDVFKSSMPKDSWPSSPTDSLEKSQKLVVHFLKQNYGVMKTSITSIQTEVFQSQISTPTLNLMDVELTFCLENMKTLRHLLAELPHLKTSDKYKIHKSYHAYEDTVGKSKQEIQKLLVKLRQKEVDLTRNTQSGVVSKTKKKQEDIPTRKDHFTLLSDYLSKKVKKKKCNGNCQRNAEMRHRFEVEKLLKEQNEKFEV